MNCQSFETIVDDLAREQLIEATVREEALAHIDACSSCAARLSEERSLTAHLRALAADMNSLKAPERVESFLLAAFNEQRLSPPARRRRWNYLSVAAAAVLLVGVGIGVAAWNLRPTRPEVAKAVTSAVIDSSPVVEGTLPGSNGAEAPASKATEDPRSVRNLNKRRRATKARETIVPASQTERGRTLSETEVATDFMPIGYVNSASLQDGGSVVRVELPRSTIVSLGFAVNMDRYGERVKADVLMGADGLARAIRFVE